MEVLEIICSLFKLGVDCTNGPVDQVVVKGLLVPTVVTMVGLYLITNTFLGKLKIKIKGIVIITFYIVFVYSGWYGALAPLFYNYVLFFLIVFGGFFILTSVISIERLEQLGNIGRFLGEKRHDILFLKSAVKQKKELLDKLDETIATLQKRGVLESTDVTVLELFKYELDRELTILNNMIESTEKFIPFLSQKKWNQTMQELHMGVKSLQNIDKILDTLKYIRGADKERDIDEIKKKVEDVKEQISKIEKRILKKI